MTGAENGMRLLVAEDEPDLNRLLVKVLKKSGYAVDGCFDGESAWDYLNAVSYDAAILDVMMPGCSGFELVKRMRNYGITVPVLFLTARDAVEDRVKGLDLGANDYLIKPFSFQELEARIRVLTRGREEKREENVYSYAGIVMDVKRHTVKRDGKEIRLSAKEFSILEYLLRNREIVLSRERIEQNVWDFDYSGASNMVDVYIRFLRKKIDEEFEEQLIHTVRGVGYVLRREENQKG